VEDHANAIVVENRPVDISFEDAAEATGLRKASTRQGPLRIITIRDLDRSACGGTHVQATGEIGSVLIRKMERARHAVRLEFLCGRRALQAARRDYELLSQLAQECTSAPEELVRVVRSLRAELKERRASQKDLETRLDLSRARELYDATRPNAAGIRLAVLRQDSGTSDALKGLAQAYASLPKAVFVGVIATPPSLVVAASRDAGLDAGTTLKALLAQRGGRGGGSPSLAQAVLPGSEQLEAVVSSLIR
jgi:alanyl-tRNA synthetase